ncbi:hypothetical protein L7F22_006382 [Adiantum nelumboides]|nr:hypothetical protein [Adiantum nelumboides]
MRLEVGKDLELELLLVVVGPLEKKDIWEIDEEIKVLEIVELLEMEEEEEEIWERIVKQEIVVQEETWEMEGHSCPGLLSSFFLALSPILLVKLSQAEGIPVQSHVVRGAARKYFYFNVFNVFLGVTIANSLFDTLSDLINNSELITSLLNKSL